MSVFSDGGIWPKESVYVADGMIIISTDEHLLVFLLLLWCFVQKSWKIVVLNFPNLETEWAYLKSLFS